jgi:hypothetical protein
MAMCAGAADAPANDVLVGVSYFAGWWEPMPNKWHDPQGADWRTRLPERVPLLGEYNDQSTMDKEILAASSHGVDFFSILWYYNPKDQEREPNARFLSRGLEGFMKSPNANRMKFMIEFCNHPPYDVTTDEQWQECVDYWVKCMAHPSYLRIDGKAVFKVHGGAYFMKQNGNDVEKSKARLDSLRAAADKAGVGPLLIGCGVGGGEAIPPDHWAAKLFDFTASYMDVPSLPQKPSDYPYNDLAQWTRDGRRNHAHDAVPYMPYLPAGWSPRPWPDPRAYFAFPTQDEWTQALKDIRDDLSNTPSLGLPGAKAFTIYAWNEFGEGGIVAPTQGDGCMKLDAIRDVFAANNNGVRTMQYTPRSAEETTAWQQELRKRLFSLMKTDDLLQAEATLPLDPEVKSTTDVDGVVLQEVSIQSTPTRRITVTLAHPSEFKGTRPGVVAIHGHGGNRLSVFDAKTDENGRIYKEFGMELVHHGFFVVAPSVGQHEVYEKDRTLMGERLWDCMRCVDYLQTLSYVDKDRIGCAGLSLGGEMAMWLGAMDTRVKATVSAGFLTMMDQMEANHCMCWKFDGLRELVDWPDVYALIAPRRLMCQNGLKEPANDFTVPLAKVALKQLRPAYVQLGAPNNVVLDVHGGAHEVDLPALVAYLDEHLK